MDDKLFWYVSAILVFPFWLWDKIKGLFVKPKEIDLEK